MTPKFLQWPVAVLGATVLAIVLGKVLGPRGRKDGVLFGGSVVAGGFVLGGVVGLVLGEKGASGFLTFGIVLAYVLAGRWRGTNADDGTLPGS